MTNDRAASIRNEVTASLGATHFLQSVHVVEGWGDILWATLRISGPRHSDQSDLAARLKAAVHRSLGELRHVVRIEWEQP
jgi:hypothetical protein